MIPSFPLHHPIPAPMKTATVLTTILFCAVAVAASTAAPIPSNFIRSSCRANRYPALGIQSLFSFAPVVRHSPRQLAHIALTISADRARAATGFVSRLSTTGPKSLRSREAGAIKDCIDTMVDNVDRLRHSVDEMDRLGRAGSAQFEWHMSNVQTWVSAALTDENTCLNSLS